MQTRFSPLSGPQNCARDAELPSRVFLKRLRGWGRLPPTTAKAAKYAPPMRGHRLRGEIS